MKDKMMTHIMIDLETLGTDSNAAILSIGAVKFNPFEVQTEEELRQPGNTFYSAIDIQSCLDIGLTVTGPTLTWWFQQSQDARKVFTEHAPPLKEVLIYLISFSQNAIWWGNSIMFDNVILNNAYKTVGFSSPTSYRNHFCYRTLKNTLELLAIKLPDAPDQIGTSHNALDDAIWQAMYAQKLIRKLATT